MSEVEKVREGLYFYDGRKSPQEVANIVYGDTHKYLQILKANPEGLNEGSWLNIPNKFGRITEVQDGETTSELIQRMFPNQPVHLYIDRYLEWNGGFVAEDIKGVTIFIPER